MSQILTRLRLWRADYSPVICILRIVQGKQQMNLLVQLGLQRAYTNQNNEPEGLVIAVTDSVLYSRGSILSKHDSGTHTAFYEIGTYQVPFLQS